MTDYFRAARKALREKYTEEELFQLRSKAGTKGGKKTMAQKSPEERKEQARKASLARWKKKGERNG